mmetsp:Transcript_36838/g.91719  ORF Transcript_36838/g.91719 Transcript_36838/m.91719 type:complete len:164 (+) Transcript_36838:239-730(+)
MQFYVVFKRPQKSIILTGQAIKGTLRKGFSVEVPRCPNVLSAVGYTAKGERRKRDDKDPDDDDLYTKIYMDDPCPNWHEVGDRPMDHGGVRKKKLLLPKFKRVVARAKTETAAEAAVRHAAADAVEKKRMYKFYGDGSTDIDTFWRNDKADAALWTRARVYRV